MATKNKPTFVRHADVMAKKLKDPEFRYYYEQRRLVHEVALAIRGMRKGAGLTQAKLAEMIEVSQPMIARLERGHDQRTPSWDTLRKIAIALGKRLRFSFVDPEKDSDHLVEVDGKAPEAIDANEDQPASR